MYNSKINLLITGADGFVGSALLEALSQKKIQIRACVRNLGLKRKAINNVEYFNIFNIDYYTDWGDALKGIDVVVHLAAKAHDTRKPNKFDEDIYSNTNLYGTERLFDSCINSEVKRFIFLSSTKVVGEGRHFAYSEVDVPNPGGSYALSKFKAEKYIIANGKNSPIDWVILRAPLVYGPAVKANFLSLIKIVDLGIPLPFKSVTCKRSMIYIKNLIDAISVTMCHPMAANDIFFVSDDNDLSLPILIEEIARGLGRKPMQFPIPSPLLEFIFKVSGNTGKISKLLRPFVVDIAKIKRILGWSPPFTVNEGIADTISWYKSSQRL